MRAILITFIFVFPLFAQLSDSSKVELPTDDNGLCWKYKISFNAKPEKYNSFFRIYLSYYSKEMLLDKKILGWSMTYSFEPGFYTYTQERFTTGYNLGFERGKQSIKSEKLKYTIIGAGIITVIGLLYLTLR